MKRHIYLIFILFIAVLALSSCEAEEQEDPVQTYKTHVTEILEEEGTIFQDNKSNYRGDLTEDTIPSGLIYSKILFEDTDTPALLMGWTREGEDELPTQLYISLNKASESGARETGHITENTHYTDEDNYFVNVYFRDTEEDKYIIWSSKHESDNAVKYREKVYRVRGSKLKSLMNISIKNSETNGFNTNIYSLDGTPMDENVVIPKESNKKDVPNINAQILQAQRDCTEDLKERLSQFGLEDTIDENGYPVFEDNKDDLIINMEMTEGKYKIKSYSRPDSILRSEE